MSDGLPKLDEARRVVADGLMGIPEAAKFLSVSRGMIYKLMDSGEIGSLKIGRNRRIPRLDVQEYAARQLTEGYEGHLS